jgi:hypothetical protein
MKNKYSGMTVNERLYVGGLIDDYDRAVESNDRNKAALILTQVELGEESIDDILNSLGMK